LALSIQLTSVATSRTTVANRFPQLFEALLAPAFGTRSVCHTCPLEVVRPICDHVRTGCDSLVAEAGGSFTPEKRAWVPAGGGGGEGPQRLPSRQARRSADGGARPQRRHCRYERSTRLVTERRVSAGSSRTVVREDALCEVAPSARAKHWTEANAPLVLFSERLRRPAHQVAPARKEVPGAVCNLYLHTSAHGDRVADEEVR
jgi:hypothetical protein